MEDDQSLRKARQSLAWFSVSLIRNYLFTGEILIQMSDYLNDGRVKELNGEEVASVPRQPGTQPHEI